MRVMVLESFIVRAELSYTRTPPTLFPAVSVNVTGNGKRLQARFNRADIDNNMPAGSSVPLTFTANFMNGGVQKQLTSTALVRVIK